MLRKYKIFLISLLFTNTAIGADMVNINFKEFKLDNGLRLIVHEDHKAPIVAVNLWYHVGSKNEVKGKTGFAHLFEHLMFNGSENYNDEFFKPFERVGATNMNGTTYFDRTNYFENVPNTALDLALWMESDRMGHMLGAITQERLDEQRGVVQNEKRQGDNQPYGMVEYHLLEGIFLKIILIHGAQLAQWKILIQQALMMFMSGLKNTMDLIMQLSLLQAMLIQMKF